MAQRMGEKQVIISDEDVIIPFDCSTNISDRERLGVMRRKINTLVVDAYELSIKILAKERPGIPIEVVRAMISASWTDGTMRDIEEFEPITDIERALKDAWDEIERLNSEIDSMKFIGEDRNSTLHIYGQPYWHEDLLIVGTPSALLRLEYAAKEATRTGKAELEDMQTNDGQSYKVVVVRESETQLEKRKAPYYDAY